MSLSTSSRCRGLDEGVGDDRFATAMQGMQNTSPKMHSQKHSCRDLHDIQLRSKRGRAIAMGNTRVSCALSLDQGGRALDQGGRLFMVEL